MSTDYRIKICRKVDDKLLAICNANQLKSILDSEYSKIIHCDGRNCNNVKFTTMELEAVANAAFDKIKELYRQINEKNLLIALAQNCDVKHELDVDITYIKDEIEEQTWIIESAYNLRGVIDCVVEDLWDKDDKMSAYTYNGLDLPEKEREYANGEKYKYHPTVWSVDTYCVIEANY